MDGEIVCMDRTGKLYRTDTPHPDDVIVCFPSTELKNVLGSSIERLDKDVAEGLITKLKNLALVGSIALGILVGLFFTAPVVHAEISICFQQPTSIAPIPCPYDVSALPNSSTIAVTNTFQSAIAAPAAGSIRAGCFIQNQGFNNMFIFIGSGSATKAKSIIIVPNAGFTCSNGAYGVEQQVLQITGTSTDAYMFWSE